MPQNVYLRLTEEFNQGELRAIISSGQAVVLHRLAVMSKDGDWILREDEHDLGHVLRVLNRHGARYRFGAPLHVRWLAAGWSSHFEYQEDGLRVRTDFVTRPPRLTVDELDSLWKKQQGQAVPFIDAKCLAEIKKTNREKDYPVIGELARLLTDPREKLLLSRSARDLVELAARHPELVKNLAGQRRVLLSLEKGVDALEVALDVERRELIRANAERLSRYAAASAAWRKAWPSLDRKMRSKSLLDAHQMMCQQAKSLLPTHIALGS